MKPPVRGSALVGIRLRSVYLRLKRPHGRQEQYRFPLRIRVFQAQPVASCLLFQGENDVLRLCHIGRKPGLLPHQHGPLILFLKQKDHRRLQRYHKQDVPYRFSHFLFPRISV